MEKKIEVEINGRKVRIMPHMLSDAAKFGATQEKRIIKETPKELLKSPIKTPLPEMEEVEPEPQRVNLPDELKEPEPGLLEKPKRKSPVRSKSK